MNMEDDEGHDGFAAEKTVTPALLALHPFSKFVVVSVGSQLRVFNLLEKCAVDSEDINSQSCHVDAIKTITFSKDGGLFASAGDDKHVKLWDTDTWRCLRTVVATKKISASSFSSDGKWLLYADKFGVVYAISTEYVKDPLAGPADPGQPVSLLAHCCSIITSLKCSADGRYIITADRDFKIRISIFPKNPLMGAHEIEGFCLGHTSFVSCVAVVNNNLTSQFLVSGGGDGTVRLWEVETATLLDTVDVYEKITIANSDVDNTAVQLPAITCIAVSNNASLVAVGLESLDGVIILGLDIKSKRLRFLQKFLLEDHYCPTSIQFDRNGWLWLVAGAAQRTEAGEEKATSWVKVVSISSGDAILLESIDPASLPGGTLLLEALDGTDSDVKKALALADAANMAVKEQLSKKKYTNEHRELRKRLRNDKKLQKGM
ncbi:hypothetical protein KP509_08G049500 [Ceratopteris richardii]|uniref:tRNA (guanine-N(7)-)-methyltransferase non-catalytic subunit n=1 Tax=Ceratopteris richardii TaxID=49495 RepID=A0A8T2UD31_CERRI|nr:hypothetical protein KP509_08G049500 [Ceratopteris richardii]